MPPVTTPSAPADSTVPRRWASKRIVLAGAAAAVLLAAASTFAFAAGRGAFSGSPTCTVPSLSGTVVEVTAVDMGHMNGAGMMMNGRRYAMPTMRLFAIPATVPAGGVSLLVRNAGSRTHELVVLPLADGASAGTRTVGADGRIDEGGSLGEVSRTCGAGAGDGIRPGSAAWVTLQLAPGRYELACNETDHYAQGMWTELVVT
jgi:uncharacterized cupredoxin-like copper-binding protein